jgi:hypothetical protein
MNLITLDDTLRDQQSLDELCADRQLASMEIFSPNSFYGIAQVIKQYASLESTYQLKVIIPHGLVLDDHYLWEAEKKSDLPVVWVYPEYRYTIYSHQTDKQLVHSASPFLYLQALYKDQPMPDKRGTLFFPHHSTHHVTAKMDFDQLATQLARLEEIYHPITVSIYWRDYILGHHRPFLQHGFRIVSSGHIYDPLFLHRLYHLFSCHRFVGGNGLGSHMFYAIKAGCTYFHLDTVSVTVQAEMGIVDRDISRVSESKSQYLGELFRYPQFFTTEAQSQIAEYYLGAKHFKTPKQLQAQLEEAETLYRTVQSKVRPMHSLQYWRKKAGEVKRILNNIGVRS